MTSFSLPTCLREHPYIGYSLKICIKLQQKLFSFHHSRSLFFRNCLSHAVKGNRKLLQTFPLTKLLTNSSDFINFQHHKLSTDENVIRVFFSIFPIPSSRFSKKGKFYLKTYWGEKGYMQVRRSVVVRAQEIEDILRNFSKEGL